MSVLNLLQTWFPVTHRTRDIPDAASSQPHYQVAPRPSLHRHGRVKLFPQVKNTTANMMFDRQAVITFAKTQLATLLVVGRETNIQSYLRIDFFRLSD